jgi:hypothetical protein
MCEQNANVLVLQFQLNFDQLNIYDVSGHDSAPAFYLSRLYLC